MVTLWLVTRFSYNSPQIADSTGGTKADELTAALLEIAGLLKRRVEQEDAVASRAVIERAYRRES
jgi:hypothetical protein